MSDSEYGILGEQIKGLTTLINAQFMEVHERLDKINGTVGKHDDQINEALVERAKNREEQKSMIPNHIINCPNKDLINSLNKWKDEQITKENEKIHQESVKTRNWTKTIGVISVAIALGGMIIGMIKMKNDMDRQFQNLGTPVISSPRGEKIPSDVVIKMWPNDFNDTIK